MAAADQVTEHARLKEYITTMPGQLDARVNEGGEPHCFHISSDILY